MTIQIYDPGASDASVSAILGRYHEYRIALTNIGFAFNDGDQFLGTLDAYARFAQAANNIGTTFQTTFGSGFAIYRQVDSRRCFSPEAAAGARCSYAIRPHGGSPTFPIDFRASYGAVTSDASAVPSLFAVSWMAWCRKRNAGDSSHSRSHFGFSDNTLTSPSATVARCGLMGDGAGGYRFGSNNCPDGLIAGENAAGDIDANGVQPAELVAPGTNWFHVRIKMVPPTPSQGGQWAAFLNGRRAALFTSSVNFPRGAQTTSYDYTRIEASLINFGDGAAVLPNLLFSDLRLWVEEDLTV